MISQFFFSFSTAMINSSAVFTSSKRIDLTGYVSDSLSTCLSKASPDGLFFARALATNELDCALSGREGMPGLDRVEAQVVDAAQAPFQAVVGVFATERTEADGRGDDEHEQAACRFHRALLVATFSS